MIYTYLNPLTLTCGAYTTLSGLAYAHGLKVQSIRVAFSRSGKDVITLRSGIIILRSQLTKNANLVRENGFS